MIRKSFICSLLSLCFSVANAQDDQWDVYMAQYEKGVGSVLINISAKNIAPVSGYPFILVTGITYTGCNPDGLPAKAQFEDLYTISDSVKKIIDKHTSNILVGTFTYQCERLDYYYIKDTSGIRLQLDRMYTSRFKKYSSYISIKEDKKWLAYLDFLYPNEETLEYMGNQKVVMKLVEAGDKLEKERQVDHWIYFVSGKDRDCFIAYATRNGFKVEAKEHIADATRPFKLQISRVDKIDMSTITDITLSLRREAPKCNGVYDGWETFVIK